MKTTIDNFWGYFKTIQYNIRVAKILDHWNTIDQYVEYLNNHVAKVHKKIQILLFFDEDQTAHIIFSVHGSRRLKSITHEIMKKAPLLENWEYHLGLEPYSDPVTPLELYFPEIRDTINSKQVILHIHKIYNSTNKIHLHVYFDIDKTGIPKATLHKYAKVILLLFLGDDLYYKNISMIKIIRRKFKSKNFFPLKELKNILEFKVPV